MPKIRGLEKFRIPEAGDFGYTRGESVRKAPKYKTKPTIL